MRRTGDLSCTISRVSSGVAYLAVLLLLAAPRAEADNPIIPGQGVCDPHIHIFNDKAYLFSTHDYGKGERIYKMLDWQLFSSADLVHWKKEFVLRPEDTFLGPCHECYAPEGATRNGKFYFYFAEQQKQTGVAVSDQPEGPYVDALHKPLLPRTLAPTAQYDPAVFIDDDAGHTPYILWGYSVQGKSYYMARLAEDMITLAEPPRQIVIENSWKNDAVALHKHNGTYYLNAHGGCYGTATNVYGPYTYRGKYTKEYADHGSLFRWHNQTFTSFGVREDRSDPFYRTTKITYAYYKDNGDLVVDDWIANTTLGVGQYDARWPRIQAEWFFAASDGVEARERPDGWEVRGLKDGAWLRYPHVQNLATNVGLSFCVSDPKGGSIEIREGDKNGAILGTVAVPATGSETADRTVTASLRNSSGTQDFCFVFRCLEAGSMRLDWWAASQVTEN